MATSPAKRIAGPSRLRRVEAQLALDSEDSRADRQVGERQDVGLQDCHPRLLQRYVQLRRQRLGRQRAGDAQRRVIVDGRLERHRQRPREIQARVANPQVQRRDPETLHRGLAAILEIDPRAEDFQAGDPHRPRPPGRVGGGARRRCLPRRVWRGCEKPREVDRAVGIEPCIGLQAARDDAADRDRSTGQRQRGVGDGQRRNPHPILADAAGAQCEARQAHLGDLHLQFGRGAELQPVLSTEVDRAFRETEWQRIADELSDASRLQAGDGEVAVRRNLRRQREPAAPVELLAIATAGREAERPTLGRGAEVLQREANRGEAAHEGRLPAGEFDVFGLAVTDRERLDPQVRQGGLADVRGGRRRIRGRRGRQVREVQRTVAPQHGAHRRALEVQVAEHPGAAPQRRQLEVDEQPAQRQHRLSVAIGEDDVAHLELQLERLHSHCADLQLATVGLANRGDGLVADQPGGDAEAEERIQAEQQREGRRRTQPPRLEDRPHRGNPHPRSRSVARGGRPTRLRLGTWRLRRHASLQDMPWSPPRRCGRSSATDPRAAPERRWANPAPGAARAHGRIHETSRRSRLRARPAPA